MWGANEPSLAPPGTQHPPPRPRAACRRPSLAILDEPTSAVSEEAAAQLYGQLQVAGITCIRWATTTGDATAPPTTSRAALASSYKPSAAVLTPVPAFHACSIGQDSEHLRRLHRQLLQLGCGPPEGAWQLRQLG